MLIECYYRLYSLEEMVDAVVFVGGVDGVGAESEAHQYGFYSQNFFETRDDRYAAAAAHWDGQLAVCVEECLFCCFICRHFYFLRIINSSRSALPLPWKFYLLFDNLNLRSYNRGKSRDNGQHSYQSSREVSYSLSPWNEEH